MLRLLVVPFRAPSLLLLFGVAVVMGNHWSLLQSEQIDSLGIDVELFWIVEVLQAVLLVVVCTMPDLILRQVSLLMAASRAISLMVVLLLVITAGLYLLHLSLLADVLILASAVLLARLDLTRIRVVPPPVVMAIALGLILLGGIWIGQQISTPLHPRLAELLAG